MATDQSRRKPTARATRRFSVARKTLAGVRPRDGLRSVLAPSDDGPRRRRRLDDALDHRSHRQQSGATIRSRPIAIRSMRAGDRSVSISRRRCRLIFSSLARSSLHLLDAIAVAEQLEVLPGREQQHQHEEDANQRRAPHLTVTLAIDLADDRVVADVLLDGVFEGSPLMSAPPVYRVRRPQLGASRARVPFDLGFASAPAAASSGS